MKVTGKLDTLNILKRASRDVFAGMDVRTRKVVSKKAYKRKTKHAARVDY